MNPYCEPHGRFIGSCTNCHTAKSRYWYRPLKPTVQDGEAFFIGTVPQQQREVVTRQLPEPSRKYARYLKWIAANPDLIGIGVQICRDRIDSGLAFYGGPKIAGDIRYHYQTVRGEEHFNVNNDFVPYLTRAINNELRMDFLEVRSAQADIDMNYRRWSNHK